MLPGFKTTTFMLRANKKVKELASKIDIVHYTNDYCGFTLSRSKVGKPVFATLHHTHTMEYNALREFADSSFFKRFRTSISQRILARMEKSTMEKADPVVVVSNATFENGVQVYPSLKEKMRVVLNGIDDTRFSPGIDGSKFRSSLGLASEPVVLFVGRLANSKGVGFLIDSFNLVRKKVSDAKLVIVGEGSSEDVKVLKEKAKSLGTSVIFAGKVSEEALPMAYAASDVVVLPSLVEGFGLVLLEAMAESKPVIATDTGPSKEIITGEEGLLVPKGNVERLAVEIIKVLTDKSLATRMGVCGRRTVEERFSIEKWSSKMIELYHSTLS